jgi:hypothetical protein
MPYESPSSGTLFIFNSYWCRPILDTVPSPALKVAKRQSDEGESNGVIVCAGLNKTAVVANEQLQQTTELADASCDIFCHLLS